MYIYEKITKLTLTTGETYDLVKVEDINTQGEDHIYDETRYMCMYKPISSPRAKNEKGKMPEFDPLEQYARPTFKNPYAF